MQKQSSTEATKKTSEGWPIMMPTEKVVKEQLEAEGWQVFNNGWPDFLCLRGGEYKCVEVKTPYCEVTKAQARMHSILALAGIKTEILPRPVLVVDRCPQGHAWRGNTILRKNGQRECRQCSLTRSRKWRRK